MHLLDNRGEVWKTFIVLVPTIGAALIADTRIMDARHHPFDVISGSLLGIATAWASYRQYFGPVMESWRKGRAYAIRTWGRAPIHPNDRQEPVYDNSVEPLRALDNHPTSVPADEEAIPSSYQHPGANIVPQENVFREQIHRSQRQRGGADGRGGGGRERTYDQGDADLATAYNPSHPYDTSGSRRRNYRPHDGYASSSSEDRDWDQHDPYDNGFELQQQYTLSDPQGTRGNFMADEDTAYSSGGGASRPDNNYGAPERGGSVPAQVHQQPDSSAGPLHVPIPAPEIDLAATAAPPAPSSQLLQQHAARKPVDLVETYAAGVK
jgi:diacylglycerol diphosphate phosphatase/phosphatidate phosphatase